jgi:VCBS repeat-containing protein
MSNVIKILQYFFCLFLTFNSASATTYSFTNAGVTGRNGPTQAQIDTNYTGTNLENNVTINTRGIQEWTVPADGNYSIEALGASGGNGIIGSSGGTILNSGLGAQMEGHFELSQGDVLKIIVGQSGKSQTNNSGGGGGGGGSFVVKNGNALIVAGGGGGAGGRTNQHGVNANITTSGNQTSDGTASGGQSGQGGPGGGSTWGAGGGGGFLSNGGNGGNSATGGLSFSNGAVGGAASSTYPSIGGFGGGGGVGYSGGGGGGYSGGAGGPENSQYPGGGGGGSYNAGSDQNNSITTNSGHGKVIIRSLGPVAYPPVITQGVGPLTKTINEDTTATWTASELNATDGDTNASSLAWSLVTAPSHGTAIVDGNGSYPTTLSYQPNANFNGSDSFSVQVSDGENNDSIIINMTVNSVNDNPTIYSINGQFLSSSLTAEIQVPENSSVSLDINASDAIEGDTLTFQKTAGADRDLFDLNSSTGILSFPSPPDFENPSDSDSNNTYEIWFRANDGNGGFDEKRLTIRVTNVIEDNDGDGIEDAHDPDDDNDGFSDATEIAYGSNPLDANSTANASPTDLNTSSPLQIAENQTIGSIVGQLTATDPDANSTLTFGLVNQGGQSPADAMDNHLFSMDSNGTLKTAAVFDFESNSSFTINAKVRDQYNVTIKQTFTVQITNIVEDFDGDGIEDANDPDDDNDGFSDYAEIAYGSNPLDANSTANAPPANLNVASSLQTSENQSVGTVVGQLTATDPDANATLTFTLVSGENDNHLFSIDSNGTLKTAAVFNYESNSSHTIQAKVRDQYNLWIKENFTVQITNIIEDLDGDGTEDHFDPDDDNDGFSDAVEIAYGSDPMDANSTANAAPTDLNTTSTLQVSENQSAGTVVGQLTATDPDANATLTFTLVDGSNDNDLFTIETNGTLRSASVFDFESNSSYTIRVKVRDQYNLSIKENFTVQITNIIEDLDGDGTEDHFDPDDDGDGFPDVTELVAGTDPRNPASLPNRPPSTLDLNSSSILESLPVGSVVGTLSATDPDANSTLTFSLVDGNGSDYNQNFSIDTNGTLLTTTVLDYESNVTAYHVRVRVTDEFNATLESNFTISLLDALPPFVRTLETIESTNQEVYLHGQTDTGLGLPLFSYGFQLSQSSLLSNFSLWNGTTLTESNFSSVLLLAGLQPDSRYFFRAFASNAEGTTYGTIQSFIIPPLTTTGPWWESVPKIAGGWHTSSWFASFLPYANGWLYHADLGWLYSHSGPTADLWLWSAEHGWLWTANGVYPYLFQNSSANWLYFLIKKDGVARFYDYTTKSFK